jgi:hypothetical protein
MGGFGKVRPIVQSAPTARSLGIDRDRKTTAMLEDLSCGDVAQLEEHLLCNSLGSCAVLTCQNAGFFAPKIS